MLQVVDLFQVVDELVVFGSERIRLVAKSIAGGRKTCDRPAHLVRPESFVVVEGRLHVLPKAVPKGRIREELLQLAYRGAKIFEKAKSGNGQDSLGKV